MRICSSCVRGYREKANRLPLETIMSQGAVWGQLFCFSFALCTRQTTQRHKWKWLLQNFIVSVHQSPGSEFLAPEGRSHVNTKLNTQVKQSVEKHFGVYYMLVLQELSFSSNICVSRTQAKARDKVWNWLNSSWAVIFHYNGAQQSREIPKQGVFTNYLLCIWALLASWRLRSSASPPIRLRVY